MTQPQPAPYPPQPAPDPNWQMVVTQSSYDPTTGLGTLVLSYYYLPAVDPNQKNPDGSYVTNPATGKPALLNPLPAPVFTKSRSGSEFDPSVWFSALQAGGQAEISARKQQAMAAILAGYAGFALPVYGPMPAPVKPASPPATMAEVAPGPQGEAE